ncbi:YxeA family protein [Vagococcus sp. JNUCC 83]
MIKKVILAVVLILVVIFGYKGYVYYTETYKGETAYAKVSEEVPTLEDTKDDTGKLIPGSKTYKYDFNFVKEDGSVQRMDYELSGDNVTPLKPGSYIKVSLSSKRIVSGPNDVSKSDIPKNVLEKLDR